MSHFRAEVIRHNFSEQHGHHRVQAGIFNSIESLRKKLDLQPDETLNRCLHEVIVHDKFKIVQGETEIFNWTSEDADGGANRMIFNNLTGKNFSGTEYEVYLADQSEKLNIELQPEMLKLEREKSDLPEILDMAGIGWLQTQDEMLVYTPGIFLKGGERHLIFRYEKDGRQLFFSEWLKMATFAAGDESEKPIFEASGEIYQKMQNPMAKVPGRVNWQASEFDYWLVGNLEEIF